MRMCFAGRPRGNSIGLSYTVDNILERFEHFRNQFDIIYQNP